MLQSTVSTNTTKILETLTRQQSHLSEQLKIINTDLPLSDNHYKTIIHALQELTRIHTDRFDHVINLFHNVLEKTSANNELIVRMDKGVQNLLTAIKDGKVIAYIPGVGKQLGEN